MNTHILGDAMAVQWRNDQNIVNHTYAKAQHKWYKLVIIVKHCLPLLKLVLIKLALEQLLQMLGFNAWDVGNVF
jgi:hypothetical protein